VQEEIIGTKNEGKCYQLLRDVLWTCLRSGKYAKHILTYGAETWTWTKADFKRPSAAQMRYLRIVEGKTKRERIRSKKITEKLKVNTLEGKLVNNRIRWCGQVLRMN
jgi:hypothetical protein